MIGRPSLPDCKTQSTNEAGYEMEKQNSVTENDGRKPVLMVRSGRGRLGGSGMLLYAIQRARAQGRRVKPMDGDLKSHTLADYYLNDSTDGCSAPGSENTATFKDWVLGELDQMAEDGISRVIDISGGDRVLQELLQDLHLSTFCDSLGIRFVSLCMIGPDVEDFRHISEAADAGDLQPDRMMLVMNEGVVRQGQNPIGAFAGARPFTHCRMTAARLLTTGRPFSHNSLRQPFD